MKKTILTLSLVLTAIAASAKADVDTLVVTTTPQMHCSGCENKIKNGVRFVKGTKDIITSVPNQTVTIVYDKAKSGVADFQKAFKKIGYEIKDVTK